MNQESRLVAEIWDVIHEVLPKDRKLEIAIAIIQKFEQFGFDERDMHDIVDEDRYLAKAYSDVFGDEEEEQEDEYE